MLMHGERHDDRLDAAIDAAARSLTAGEPPAVLRATVRERISRRNSVRWLVPAGAMAVVAVMFVGQALFGPAGGPEQVRPTGVRVTIPSRGAAPPQPDVERLVVATTAPTVSRSVDAPAPALEEPEPMIEPLRIEPLETKLITVDDSSGVMPIEIEPLQIEPLRGD